MMCLQALSQLLFQSVPRPEHVISLDLLRKELEERIGGSRAETAAQTQQMGQQIEQLQKVGARKYSRSHLRDRCRLLICCLLVGQWMLPIPEYADVVTKTNGAVPAVCRLSCRLSRPLLTQPVS